jgi:hypothetical protein
MSDAMQLLGVLVLSVLSIYLLTSAIREFKGRRK